MGIDTNVLLRIRSSRALREALEHPAREPRIEGEGADSDAADDVGFFPPPMLTPLADGNVVLFSGIRFDDTRVQASIAQWLRHVFGDALPDLHDDPRGVFVYPDVAEPGVDTYDGIVAALDGDGGRFIDPTPPSAQQLEAEWQAMRRTMKAMAALDAAETEGAAALERALRAAPPEAREAWESQRRPVLRFEPLRIDPMTLQDDAELAAAFRAVLAARPD